MTIIDLLRIGSLSRITGMGPARILILSLNALARGAGFARLPSL